MKKLGSTSLPPWTTWPEKERAGCWLPPWSWKALSQVYLETQLQRCWAHKLPNVLDKLPGRPAGAAAGRGQGATAAGHVRREQADAEMGRDASAAFGAKHKKAVTCHTEDWDELVTFMRFPVAGHPCSGRRRRHGTSNVIESVSSPAKVRTRKTKGAGSRAAGLARDYKLAGSAQQRWRKVNSPHLVRLLRAGVRFQDGGIVPSVGSELPTSDVEGPAACST